MAALHLLPFERAHLDLVRPWFEDAETRRWLGGPDWPGQMIDLSDRPLGEFRGAKETGRHSLLAWELGRAVGYIDCGTYDCWTTWEGGSNGRGVVSVISVPSGGVAYVVDPGLRRRGYCRAMLGELVELPELSGIELFAAGVEAGNLASVGCLLASGFEALRSEPDWEGIVYYVKMRSASPGIHG